MYLVAIDFIQQIAGRFILVEFVCIFIIKLLIVVSEMSQSVHMSPAGERFHFNFAHCLKASSSIQSQHYHPYQQASVLTSQSLTSSPQITRDASTQFRRQISSALPAILDDGDDLENVTLGLQNVPLGDDEVISPDNSSKFSPFSSQCLASL